MNPSRRWTKAAVPVGLIAGMLAAVGLSLSLIVLGLHPPREDIELLALFMIASGSASILGVYLLVRTGLLARFNSLRWTLVANIILLVVLVFVNVWLTAQLMFISTHDFVLTMALLVFAGVVGALCVFYVANTWIRRISDLGVASEKVASGDLHTRLPVQGNDELAQLTRAFNQMGDSLQTIEIRKQELEQTRRDLIAWVSHDLRTPLATIRAMNESLLDGMVSDPETVYRYILSIQGEVAYLSRMIDDLFALAQLDAGQFALKREPASLRDLISDSLGSMTAQADQLGVRLSGTIVPGVDVVTVAPDKIQRVLHNLLENALHHTPRGGAVSVCADRNGAYVEVSVHNTGSMIPREELPHLFESFYRIEPSRARNAGHRGTGLGLAIVRGFVEAHGGTVHVESSAAEGTRFRVRLPQP